MGPCGGGPTGSGRRGQTPRFLARRNQQLTYYQQIDRQPPHRARAPGSPTCARNSLIQLDLPVKTFQPSLVSSRKIARLHPRAPVFLSSCTRHLHSVHWVSPQGDALIAYSSLVTRALMTVVETPTFLREAASTLSDREKSELVSFLAQLVAGYQRKVPR